jgi:dienelactone hydrolase
MKTSHKLSALLFSFSFAASAWAQFWQPDYSFKPTGLEKIEVPGHACTGFFRTPTFNCRQINILTYLGRAKDGSRNSLVILSGNAGGMDSRHLDYAKFLNENNINAVVIDTFKSRGYAGGTAGIGTDRNLVRSLGVDSSNMAYDALTVSSRMAETEEWKDTKIGFLGESLSGGAASHLVRQFSAQVVQDRNPGMQVRDFDAIVAIYPPCLDLSPGDKFKTIPFLFILAEKDDATPAENCVRQSAWMNGRGGDTSKVTIPGEYHDFDGPWPLKTFDRSQNTGNCSSTRIGGKFVLTSNGKEFPDTPQGYADMYTTCATVGFKSGHQGKPRLGYDIWLAFFKEKLMGI